MEMAFNDVISLVLALPTGSYPTAEYEDYQLNKEGLTIIEKTGTTRLKAVYAPDDPDPDIDPGRIY